MIEIKCRFTLNVLFRSEAATTLRQALEEAVSSRADLTRAKLTGADLTDANLTGADLTGADLTRADLTRAKLTRAKLTRAKLTGADLTGANLTGANLTGADLTGADLTGADLTRADLTDAKLTGADLTGADLTRANLTRAKLPSNPMLRVPESLEDAAAITREWLAGDHWIQGSWIKTPTAYAAGDCLACLHGAAVYCGGPFGPELSQKLSSLGFTEVWNDQEARTKDEVLAALDTVAGVL